VNEEQLKLFIRHAFALERTAGRIVDESSPALARAMVRIRELVRSIPKENLMREAGWRKMLGQVAAELKPYNDALAASVVRQLQAEAPEMAKYAEEMLQAVKSPTVPGPSGRIQVPSGGAMVDVPGLPLPMQTVALPQSVSSVLALNDTRVGGKRLAELFEASIDPLKPAPNITPWIKANVKTIDRVVKTGILQGAETSEIANKLFTEITTGGGPSGIRMDGGKAADKIRKQARALARTAVQDYNRQVNEQVWDANPLSDGLMWEWTSALDSRTCPRCAPLDSETKSSRKEWASYAGGLPPLHVNCRCSILPMDPDDPGAVRTGTMIAKREAGLTKGVKYKSKVYVKGEKFYRSTIVVKDTAGKAVRNPTYGDFLVSVNETSRAEFFGGGEQGRNRASRFMVRVRNGENPEVALSKMVTGPPGRTTFVSEPPLPSPR